MRGRREPVVLEREILEAPRLKPSDLFRSPKNPVQRTHFGITHSSGKPIKPRDFNIPAASTYSSTLKRCLNKMGEHT